MRGKKVADTAGGRTRRIGDCRIREEIEAESVTFLRVEFAAVQCLPCVQSTTHPCSWCTHAGSAIGELIIPTDLTFAATHGRAERYKIVSPNRMAKYFVTMALNTCEINDWVGLLLRRAVCACI